MVNPSKQNWTTEMQAWPSHHSTGTKQLLNGTLMPAGQTPEKDFNDAPDNIANHPNVGAGQGRPFALHPSLGALASLFEAGQCAAVANVGTLAQPATRA